MREAVIGVDIGTTGVRAVVFDLEGRALGEAYREVRLSTPRPDRAEQDPDAIVAAVFEVIPQALASAGEVSPVAVGLSSPLHTLLAVGGNGRPLTPLHTWADNRAARQVFVVADNQVSKAVDGLCGAVIAHVKVHTLENHVRWSNTSERVYLIDSQIRLQGCDVAGFIRSQSGFKSGHSRQKIGYLPL